MLSYGIFAPKFRFNFPISVKKASQKIVENLSKYSAFSREKVALFFEQLNIFCIQQNYFSWKNTTFPKLYQKFFTAKSTVFFSISQSVEMSFFHIFHKDYYYDYEFFNKGGKK